MTAKSQSRLIKRRRGSEDASESTHASETLPPEADPSAAKPLAAGGLRWKVVAQVGLVLLVLWVTALMTVPQIGYWGVGIMAVLTIVVLAFGLYIWRMLRRTRSVATLLQGATDEAGRVAALNKLESGDTKDAFNALARAQIVSKDNPQEAISILEAVDLKKAPAVAQDDLRANLALLYLMHNRVKEAAPLADELRLDRQPNPQAKALYAAVIAETKSRTGAANDAKALLETFPAHDPAYGEARTMLLRAQVYTFSATRNRGLARKAMQSLAGMDPNLLGAFMQKGAGTPEITKLARETLATMGLAPKVRVRPKMG